MRRFNAVLLLFSILLLSGAMYAQERKGTELIIEKKDGYIVVGELITVKQNSLLLKERESGIDVTIDVNAIEFLTIVKKSKVWKGASTGALFSVGWITIAALLSVGDLDISEIRWDQITYFVLSSALIGASIGALVGKDEKIPFSLKSVSEKQVVLEKLRMKARVTDYQ